MQGIAYNMFKVYCCHNWAAGSSFIGLHIQKAYTSYFLYANPIVICSCMYAFCLRIAIRHSIRVGPPCSMRRCTHLGLIAIKMHICMSSQQKNLVYALWQEVLKPAIYSVRHLDM